MKILETQRLILRRLFISDAEYLYQLNSDPEVIKYTGNKAFENIGNAKVFLQNYTYHGIHGLGRWAVIHKSEWEFFRLVWFKIYRGLG